MNPIVTEHYLLPSTSMQAFLSRLERRAPHENREALMETWWRARHAMYAIEAREAGAADAAAVLEIPHEMTAAVESRVATPMFRRASDRVPISFGMVDIDAVMCPRPVLREETLVSMRSAFAHGPDDAELVAICLPMEPHASGTDEVFFDGKAVSVISESEDIAVVPDVQAGSATAGEYPAAIATLRHVITRPARWLHAIRKNGRLLLVEGHHRARVLRGLGETYLPCLISACGDDEDVQAAAPWLAGTDLARFFESPRPPMLKDFDRAALLHRYSAQRLRTLLRLTFQTSVATVS